jgi:hypothetical protein
MNLEINIKVPLGAAGVSVAQPTVTTEATPAQATTAPAPAASAPSGASAALPDAFPPSLDPARSIPWGEPQRTAPHGELEVSGDVGPPSLSELGVSFDPPSNFGPPSLPELLGSAGRAPGNGGLTPGNGGVPPGLEAVDLPTVALAGIEAPPPELELEAQATSELHMPPLPEDLMRQMRANKGASGKPRKE